MRARARTRIGIGLVVVGVLALGLTPLADAEPRTRLRAADALLQNLDMGYVKQVTRHLGTIGSSKLGFRVTGTPQDEETASYLADQMDAIGLEDVSVETLTDDGWLFTGGSVHAKGSGLDRSFPVSSLGSMPGTPQGGVSGRIVPVGYGTAPEYEGLNVKGKIAFAWWDYDNKGIWPNHIAYEAKTHGAKAVIIASAPSNGFYAAGGGRALGSFDGVCGTTTCASLVVISRRNALTLVKALDAGKVQGSVTLNAKNLLDATAHQPIGQIAGSVYPERSIVFTAHQDAWFTSAADDSVSVGMILAIAKAAIESGYQPKYTWIFAPTTGEEYGLTDAHYDWLQGAFHRITVSHTEWTTKAMAVLNWEVHSPPYYIWANVARELRGFLGDSLTASKKDGLIDYYGLADVYSWNDGFTYTAQGAPAVTFTATGPDYWSRYHTNYDSLDTLNFKTLKPVLQAETRVALDLESTLMPFRFGSRVSTLKASLDPEALARYGADAEGIDDAIAGLRAAWVAASVETPSVCASTSLREATNISDDEFTALSFGDATVYPHQQVQLDMQMLSAAINQLSNGRPHRAANSISSIDLNSLASILSPPGFKTELLHRDPSYERLSWGAQGQLTVPIDLYDMWHTVAAAKAGTVLQTEIDELKTIRAQTAVVYRARIDGLIASTDAVAAQLEAVAAC
jgi:Iap family predicted aminopeptidase